MLNLHLKVIAKKIDYIEEKYFNYYTYRNNYNLLFICISIILIYYDDVLYMCDIKLSQFWGKLIINFFWITIDEICIIVL